ncbi:MAG: DUF3987 domain-containing protein [Solirubrobacteraceae bacterium]
MISWPSPAEAAVLHGPAGEFVSLTEPHTESDPMALLAQFLVCFGTAVGRVAHYPVEASKHFGNEFIVLVGPSSKGRKGSSWDHVERLMRQVDPHFIDNCISSGMSSGEGLIAEVASDGDGERQPDKRRLVVESEFAQVMKVLSREGNTLSPVVRNAWDGKTLQTMVRNAPLRTSGTHIGIIGHITKEELLRHINGTELANGFFNRFMLIAVQRSKKLPFGGALRDEDLVEVRSQLAAAMLFAGKQQALLTFNDDARAKWIAVYDELSDGHPGLWGAATARAEAHTVRLALLYALLDCSPYDPRRAPRRRARVLGLRLTLGALGLRRLTRRPHRRRNLGHGEAASRRRHPHTGQRPLQPQQEGPRDRPRTQRPRRGRPT